MTKVKKKKTFGCRNPGKSVAEKINAFGQWLFTVMGTSGLSKISFFEIFAFLLKMQKNL